MKDYSTHERRAIINDMRKYKKAVCESNINRLLKRTLLLFIENKVVEQTVKARKPMRLYIPIIKRELILRKVG